jgi:beta-alanine degradation protein BauB
VVISGVLVNKKPDGPDVLLPAGSYYVQKGGERHVTKCTSKEGCVFFVNQSGKFDYHE